jgi:hypothetical protein
LRYEEPAPISRAEASAALASPDADIVCEALVRTAFYETDESWAEAQCLAFISDPNPTLKACAVTCLAHIARIHRRIGDSVLPLLKKMRDDPIIGGRVQDAIEDIELFTK